MRAEASEVSPAAFGPRWLHALDPRRSVRTAVSMAAGLPLAAIWCWAAPADSGGGAGVRLAGLLAIGAVAVLAGSVAAAGWGRLAQRLSERDEADLSPWTPDEPAHEIGAMVRAVNRTLDIQRQRQEAHQRLIADAAHQIRTPLAALRARLQAAAPGTLDAQLPELLQAVDRATSVANEFLARARIDQRARTVARTPLRLDELAQEAVLEFSPLIARKRLAFELDATAQTVEADPWMLGELIRNLLANAIGHTPPRAPLGIVVRQALGAPELVVWDSGPGLDGTDRARLFEPFAAASRGTGGGLGLSICRQFAEAMGAEVELHNRSDGHQVTGVDAVVRWHPRGVAGPQASVAAPASPSPASLSAASLSAASLSPGSLSPASPSPSAPAFPASPSWPQHPHLHPHPHPHPHPLAHPPSAFPPLSPHPLSGENA